MPQPMIIMCNGTQFSSQAAFARAVGLSQNTVKRRMDEGRTPEWIFKNPEKRLPVGKSIPIKYEGRRYNCIEDLAREVGIPGGTLRNRVIRLGWSVERAVTEPTPLCRKGLQVTHLFLASFLPPIGHLSLF